MRVLETHISWVLLTGEYAYKIKKPVDLGFVGDPAEVNPHIVDVISKSDLIPVIAPVGASSPLGSLGFALAYLELLILVVEFFPSALLARSKVSAPASSSMPCSPSTATC